MFELVGSLIIWNNELRVYDDDVRNGYIVYKYDHPR